MKLCPIEIRIPTVGSKLCQILNIPSLIHLKAFKIVPKRPIFPKAGHATETRFNCCRETFVKSVAHRWMWSSDSRFPTTHERCETFAFFEMFNDYSNVFEWPRRASGEEIKSRSCRPQRRNCWTADKSFYLGPGSIHWGRRKCFGQLLETGKLVNFRRDVSVDIEERNYLFSFWAVFISLHRIFERPLW